MANRLKMAVVDSIYTLLGQGHSRRWIAQALGIDRQTVRRYAELVRSKPAGAPPGSSSVVTFEDAPDRSNPATAPPGSMGASSPSSPVPARIAKVNNVVPVEVAAVNRAARKTSERYGWLPAHPRVCRRSSGSAVAGAAHPKRHHNWTGRRSHRNSATSS